MLQYAIYAGLAGLLVGALSTGILTYKYVDNKWKTAIAGQKVEAADLLAKEVDKVIKRERTLQVRVRELEQIHEQTTDTLDTLKRTNSDLIVKYGGLRDTGRRQGGSHTMPSVTSQAQCPTDSTASEARILSRELTEELNTKAALADQLTEYAWQGYKWAIETELATKVEER